MSDAVLLLCATRYTSRTGKIEVSCTCLWALFEIHLCCISGNIQMIVLLRLKVTVTGFSLLCLNVLRNWK